MSVRVFAPAKINLTLEVGRPRADGRHPLQSVVMFADVGDWVEVDHHPENPVRISGPFASALVQSEGNSMSAARDVIAMASGNVAGVSLVLEKNLPIASGIGGGSSDAAATLKALNALWGLNYDEARVCGIGRALGADVPACVAARTLYMTGTGEDWAPIEAPRLDAVLINPLKPLSTADVYRQFDAMGLGGSVSNHITPVWPDRETALRDISVTGNGLEAPARALMPEIGVIADALRVDDRVIHAGLSGSGATMFALTESSGAARALAGTLQRAHPGWWVAATVLGGA